MIIMKKKYFAPILLLLLCLFGTTAYAEPAEQEQTKIVTLTDENRYDPAYYQEPEEIYPETKGRMGRSAELSLEEYVVDALENFQTVIDVSAYQIPIAEASERYFQIVNNHPSLFYVINYVKTGYNPSTGMLVSYQVKYMEGDIQSQKAAFQKEVGKALSWVDNSMTDVEKALAVHDYLVLDCEYDYDSYQSGAVPEVSHSAYGALVEKKAVCDGYAKAYACILEELGISSKIVSSDVMSHAWNLVSIGGAWYHVDATWDDPVRDNIGRVAHKYFLLSDTAISQGEKEDEKHKGWDSGGCTADSNLYDNEFWSGVTSAFCYQNGNWYYAKYDTGSRYTSLMKRPESLDGQEQAVYTEEATWNYYTAGYMYLDLEPEKNELYFNTTTGIYRLDENEEPVEMYTPALTGSQLIFGFTVRDSKLCYALQETPNLTAKQTVLEYQPEETTLPEIEGVYAEDVDISYTGEKQLIVVQGILEGDRVTYRAAGRYQEEQPEMINAGTYQVLYKVERAGYKDYLGTAKVVIRKAKPEQPDDAVFAGLEGTSGSLLSGIALPENFLWEDGSIKLKEPGEQTFYVSYVPEDSKNYETIPHIPVKVTVACPGHKYTSKITKAPTKTEKGIKTCTCSLCGHTYNEDIPMLESGNGGESGGGSSNTDGSDGTDEGTGGSDNTGGSTEEDKNTNNSNSQQPNNPSAPKKPAKVSGLKVSKAAANSLKLSWKPVKGASYRLALYKGNAAVFTTDTNTTSYTCKKLKTATIYTVKVTSYIESNGKKAYASESTTIKAATAPAKAKLVSVKKKGASKAKITWKRTPGADGYEVFMRTGKGAYKKIKTITKGKTVTLTKSSLKKGKSYSFRIRAYKKSGQTKSYGSYSNTKTLKIKR